MSYLSRRMREEGFWRKRKPGVLTFNIEVDTSGLEAAFKRASRAFSGLAERAGLQPLDPWQEAMVDDLYARPHDGPPWVWRHRSSQGPMFTITTPDESGGLAEMVAKARDAGEREWKWPDEVIIDEVQAWCDLGYDPPPAFDRREHLGIWPTQREDE